MMVSTKHDRIILQRYPILKLFGCTTFGNVYIGQNLEVQTEEMFYTYGKLDKLMLYFQPQYIVKCAPIKQYSCYETPAFAFYFPDDGIEYRLKCAKESVTHIDVNHYEQGCRYCPQKAMPNLASLNI